MYLWKWWGAGCMVGAGVKCVRPHPAAHGEGILWEEGKVWLRRVSSPASAISLHINYQLGKPAEKGRQVWLLVWPEYKLLSLAKNFLEELNFSSFYILERGVGKISARSPDELNLSYKKCRTQPIPSHKSIMILSICRNVAEVGF